LNTNSHYIHQLYRQQIAAAAAAAAAAVAANVNPDSGEWIYCKD